MSTECNECDSTCKTCDNENGKCITCYKGYGINPENDTQCVKCSDNQYSKNNKCVNGDYQIEKCSEAISYCSKCTIDDEHKSTICIECYSPYEFNEDTNECELCQFEYHYESETFSCEENN